MRPRSMLRLVLFISVVAFGTAHLAAAQGLPAGFEDAPVAVVGYPTALAFTPDGRLLIASQLGQIYVHRNGVLLNPPALDLGSSVCRYRERGLSSVAVDPDFASNHFVYVAYIFNKFGDCGAEYTNYPVGRVSRFQLNDNNTIDRASERVLIDNVPSPIGVHNLDDLGFGKDGYLYISVGDGGCDYANNSGCFDSNNAAQDMNSLVGKILRIRSDGTIPADNPHIGAGTVRCQLTGGSQTGTTCQEIFATGVRNPWRITFDPNAAGTRFFINDVGESTWEEIDEGRAGANYGWNTREGFCANSSTTNCSTQPVQGFTPPLFAYDRSDGCAAITGGAFVPNGAWASEFDGMYLFGDYTCGRIFKLRPFGGGYIREQFMLGLGTSTIVDMLFGPENGRTVLYYVSFRNGGEVRRIAYVGAANRAPTAAFSASPLFGPAPLNVAFDGRTSSDPDGDPLTYAWNFGDGSPAASGVTAQHTYATNGTYTATLRATDPDGATAIASVRIDVGNTPPAPVILTPAADYRFAVGDTIVLQGRASDPEDGQLPDSSLTWRVIRHHNTHTHPFLPPTSGNNITFTAPGPENLGAGGTSSLAIELTAVDTAGRSTTVTQALVPRTVRLDFLSDPPGATLRIDGDELTAPVTFTSWVNYGVAVEARSQTRPDGAAFTFSSWSDGGAAAHTIISPATPSIYTARFTTVPSSPYGGVRAALPGIIEAENFDEGGPGVAYSDTTTGNTGGQHRPAVNVDIEPAADTGGGSNVGWMVAGEWLKYSVTVASAATYDLELRVASQGTGGTVHIEVDGIDRTGPLAVPDTGGWQTWTTIRRNGVSLAAGPQVWRVVLDTNGASGAVANLNYIRAIATNTGPTPYGGVRAPLPGTIQAENFDEGGDGVAYSDTTAGNAGGQHRTPTNVDVELAADTGGGYNVGWMVAGEWLKYSVTVASAGSYNLELRVASEGTGGTFHIEVNGVDKTGPLAVPDTGGWQTWTTIRRDSVSLNAGPQLWRVVIDTNGASGATGNLNYIRAVASSSGSRPYGGVRAALPGTVQAENYDEGGAGVAYSDTTGGNSGGQHRTNDVDVEATADTGGGYNVGWMRAGEWLLFSVDVGAAGTYDVEFRVASNGPGGTFHLEVNGVDQTGPLRLPNTNGFQSWATIRAQGVRLNAGPQLWRLALDANGAAGAFGNVNWIRVSPAAGAGLTRGPYLQQVTATSAIVVWTTGQPGAGEVRYTRAGGTTQSAAAQTQVFSAAQTGFDFDFYQHEAHLVGLSAASGYTYDIFTGGVDVTSGQDAFRTAPATGTGPIRFIAFGDSGVGSPEQRQLATRMASDSFDLALHAGDIAYGLASGVGGGSYRQYDDWFFAVYEPWLRSRPVFPSIGNHDDEVAAAQPYRDVFVLPEHGATQAYPDHAERYYSFDYGPVHFVALDTEFAFADPARRQAQLTWLEADLSATSQPWRVVYFHRSPYSSGAEHGSALDVRQAFGPVFERHGVQLVVSAHEHDYERSVPWREHVTDGSAVTYVVTGGGGGPLYPPGVSQWTAISASAHHYLRATAGDCAIELEAVALDGAILDRYSLDRCAQERDVTAPQVQIASPLAGATVSGAVDLQVNASDDVQVEKVDIYIDGALRAVDAAAPYTWRMETATLADGPHALEARAHDVAGRSTRSTVVSFTVANHASPTDIVLYSADISVIRGNWTRLPSTTGAGNQTMASEDRGWSSATPLPSPPDFIEATFNAPAGAYRLWLRLRGKADSKFNESVWVQFSDARDAAGAPLWRIATDRALLVNLEDCSGCGISGWGWQDNAWWLAESSVVRFTTGGPHTIRIQTREDGVDVDQIVLSPSTFFTTAPGPVRNDTRIVPK